MNFVFNGFAWYEDTLFKYKIYISMQVHKVTVTRIILYQLKGKDSLLQNYAFLELKLEF